jgi:hypothetical protein
MSEIIHRFASWIFFLVIIGILIWGMVLRIKDYRNEIDENDLHTLESIRPKFRIFAFSVMIIILISMTIIFLFRAFTE